MEPGAALIVKICGITRLEDGLAALEAGADWLGFIRWPRSPRYLPLDLCAALVENLRTQAPRPFSAVGVFVDTPAERIEQETAALGLDRVQLHGTEPPELARALSRPTIKVLRVRDAASLAEAGRFEGLDLLADTFDPALPGGTGRPYDYELLRGLIARRRVLVAGGLDPLSVGPVVAALRPFGVDVSSGVERSPGVKDPARVRQFIQAARQGAGGDRP